jgi:hypothetical protein
MSENTPSWQAPKAALCHCRVEGKKGKIRRMKYWEIIADNLSKAGWSWGESSRRLIAKGEQSGLLTHIAATESNSLCERTETLTAPLELQAAIFIVSSDRHKAPPAQATPMLNSARRHCMVRLHFRARLFCRRCASDAG